MSHTTTIVNDIPSIDVTHILSLIQSGKIEEAGRLSVSMASDFQKQLAETYDSITVKDGRNTLYYFA